MPRPFYNKIERASQPDALERNLDQIDEAFRLLSKLEILDGNLIEDVDLAGSSADNTIEHKLGRALRGWIVVRMSSPASEVGDRQSVNTTPETTLVLRTLTAVTVSLWVF